MELYKDLIVRAYKLLKSEAYHETYNLYLKKRLVEYESEVGISNLEEKLRSLDWLLSGDPNKIDELLGDIDYKIIPKKITSPTHTDDESCFISNESIFDSYNIEEVNWLIDCPIELHLIDTLWTMLVGPLLDERLSDSCFGNRIDESIKELTSSGSATRLFKFFVTQYSQWRDGAFSAMDSVIMRDSVTVVSLDIKKCYYNIRPEWSKVKSCIAKSSYDDDMKILMTSLTIYILDIYVAYWKKVEELSSEYARADDKNPALPIGLCSSKVLCNFHLSKLDDVILETLQPVYYGRYVDDVLIVLRTTDAFLRKVSKAAEIKAETLIYWYFLKTGILHKQDSESNGISECTYSIVDEREITVQQKKFCVFLVKKKQSKSVLDNMKRELLRNVSDLRIMPTDIIPEKLDRAFFGASDIIKPTKFRDLFSKPNNTNLVLKELSKIMMLAKSSTISTPKTRHMIKSIEALFQGINLLSNQMLWEKLSTLMVLTGRLDSLLKLNESVIAVIQKISVDEGGHFKCSDTAKSEIKKHLIEYLRISSAMALALTKVDEAGEESGLPYGLACQIRQVCLMRSEHISYPLLEYSDYKGMLFCSLNKDSIFNCRLDKDKIKFSPRFIHMHEYLLAHYRNCLSKESKIKPFELSKDDFNDSFGKELITECKSGNCICIIGNDVTMSSHKQQPGNLLRRDHEIIDCKGQSHGKTEH
ncbi:MAG: hypothetical protein M0Q99_09725 [Candidatus Cloacimonetes bacterium]|nr:hypothetical protein [Candidatus Cloacimonadota bacterium]MCK9335576.1 hypothetical protein [Candidatus Cloacimonadota bacterium]